MEGDASACADLAFNAGRLPAGVRVVSSAVEQALPRLSRERFDTVVVDPPRTGMSPRALDLVLALTPARLVYVSCDPATLARDAAAIVAKGYAMVSIRGFDLFPNTAHVETVTVVCVEW